MKGKNVITVNQQTMVEALQHYFDTVVFKEERAPLVSSVASKEKAYTAPGGEEFTVCVDEKMPSDK